MSACIKSPPLGRVSVRFDIGGLLGQCVEKIQIRLKYDKNEDLCPVYCYWRRKTAIKALSYSEIMSHC
jgi:hypothetical protein